MTTNTIEPQVEYVEDGSTLVHPIPFKFLAAADLLVQRISSAGVVDLVLGTDYSADGAGADDGGSLIKVSAGTNGHVVRIRRNTARSQGFDYATGDTFPAESHEAALDRLSLIAQEQDVEIEGLSKRSLLVPDGEVATDIPSALDRANKALGFGSSGEVIVVENDPVAAEASALAAVAASELAESSAQTASSAASSAQSAASQTAADLALVELAADAAAISAGLYEDEATGNAAVADGVLFRAVGATSETAVDVWRRDSAGSSTLLRSYPTVSAVQDALALSSEVRSDASFAKDFAATARVDPTVSYMPTHTGYHNAAWSDFASGFEAGSTNDDFTIKIDDVVDRAVFACLVPATAVFAQARVYRRSLSSASLNSAPGTDDTLISEAVISLGDIGIKTAMTTGRQLVSVPVPPFVVQAGFLYTFRVQLLDALAANMAFQIGYKAVAASAQRFLAFHHVDAVTSSWSNTNTSRKTRIGAGSTVSLDAQSIKATAEAGGLVPALAAYSSLEPEEIAALEPGGLFGLHKFPGGVTTAALGEEGLSRLFGLAEWGAGYGLGQYGEDFGPVTDPLDMAAPSVNPNWDGSRIVWGNNKEPDEPALYAVRTTAFGAGEYLTNTGGTTAILSCLIKDCHFDHDGAQNNVVTLNGVAADQVMEDCYVKGSGTTGVILARGVLRRVMIERTGSENLALPGNQRKFVTGCYFSKGGDSEFAGPGVHGDLFQANSDGGNFTFVGCTFYFPGNGAPPGGTNSIYEEGNPGTQNCIRLADYNTLAEDIFVLSNLGAGANQFLELWARYSGAEVNNVFIINNVLADRTEYNIIQASGVSLDFSVRPPVAGASMSNVLFWGNRSHSGIALKIGIPPPVGQTVVSDLVDGMYNFDKSKLTDRAREILHRLGKAHGVEIIDMAGDLNPVYDLGAIA